MFICTRCEDSFEKEEGRLEDDEAFVCDNCVLEQKEQEAVGQCCPKCHDYSDEFQTSGECASCGYGSI
jgi:hypothetical protein